MALNKADGKETKELNINRYATKKTVAKGLLDLALLSANASQLKLELTSNDTSWSHYLVLTLISISICFQLVVAVMLLVLARMKLRMAGGNHRAEKINDLTLGLVAVILFINVIVPAFVGGGNVNSATQ